MFEPDHSIMCMDYNIDGSRLATAGKDFHVSVIIILFRYESMMKISNR